MYLDIFYMLSLVKMDNFSIVKFCLQRLLMTLICLMQERIDIDLMKLFIIVIICIDKKVGFRIYTSDACNSNSMEAWEILHHEITKRVRF